MIVTTNNKSSAEFESMKVNPRMKLAALWGAFMYLYVYDVLLSLFEPGRLEQLMTGSMDGVEFTQGVMFASAVVVTIPGLMVIISLLLKPAVNRWVNIVVGALYTLIGVGNFLSTPDPWAYLVFFYAIEGVLSLLIVWQAWRWPKRESSPARRGAIGEIA